MWLPWDIALVLAGVLFGIGWATRSSSLPGWLSAASFEASLVAVLYASWQIAGRWSLGYVDGATERAEWLWEVERAVHLPSEQWIQSLILPHSWLVKASNIYYGGAHVPLMGVFLVWLFFAHRDRYPRWRRVLALTTAGCLVIQLLPVAPPRFIDSTGMLDTGVAFGQSVYAAMGSSNAGQLQAMPSIHVAWAVLIAAAVWTESPSRWRFLGPLHGIMTMVVVVITANHFWADGIVAVVVLVAMWRLDARIGIREVSLDQAPGPAPGREACAALTAATSDAVEGSGNAPVAVSEGSSAATIEPARALPSSTPH